MTRTARHSRRLASPEYPLVAPSRRCHAPPCPLILAGLFTLTPWASPPLALALGAALALVSREPRPVPVRCAGPDPPQTAVVAAASDPDGSGALGRGHWAGLHGARASAAAITLGLLFGHCASGRAAHLVPDYRGHQHLRRERYCGGGPRDRRHRGGDERLARDDLHPERRGALISSAAGSPARSLPAPVCRVGRTRHPRYQLGRGGGLELRSRRTEASDRAQARCALWIVPVTVGAAGWYGGRLPGQRARPADRRFPGSSARSFWPR